MFKKSCFLFSILATIKNGEFVIEDGVEDVHSQIEILLTRKLGDVGKKIHTARSRNDQVLTDIKLYTVHELKKTVSLANELFNLLVQSESSARS